MIGILAIQGGYSAHERTLEKLNVKWREVRTVAQLAECDKLIIPGGESTTFLWFIKQNGLWDAIGEFAKHKPIFGTCAGAILLAKTVINPPQTSLGVIDIEVERNSYGRQLASRVVDGIFVPTEQTSKMVFIRAPRITKIGADVEVIGKCADEMVCVRQKNIMVATFHPELTDETVWHEYFVNNFKI